MSDEAFKAARLELWNHMATTHGITLLDSELDDIEHLAKAVSDSREVSDRTALGLLVMAGDESIKEARAIIEFSVNNLAPEKSTYAEFLDWLDRARRWLGNVKGKND